MFMSSIRIKITVLCGAVILLTAGVIVLTTALGMRSSAIASVERDAKAQAAMFASRTTVDLERSLQTVGTLAGTLGGVHDPAVELDISREAVMGILRSTLAGDDSLSAIYTVWEVDAFDDLDIAYGGVDGHDDTGRFQPYLFRSEGEISLVPVQDVESDAVLANGIRAGEGYLRAKETARAHGWAARRPVRRQRRARGLCARADRG